MNEQWIVAVDGCTQYFKFKGGPLHRTDGPALILGDGTESWYFDGELHRTDGPAVSTHYGDSWFEHGRRHRTDGPAIIGSLGQMRWYVDGVICKDAVTFQQAAKLTDSEMVAIVLKYGPITHTPWNVDI